MDFRAAMKRSSSALLSLSVGSIISVCGNREGNRRRVEAVVHQAFGDVGFGDAAFGFERTQIDDAFVRDAAVFACIQNRIVFAQAFSDIVGVEQCPACCLFHALFAHHGQVHPSNRQDGCRTEGCGGNGGLPGTCAVGVGQGMPRCERGEVGFQANRTMPERRRREGYRRFCAGSCATRPRRLRRAA